MHCWHCWHMHAVIHVLIKLHAGGTVENYFYNSMGSYMGSNEATLHQPIDFK